jgi:hypothetical protein
MLDEAWTTFDRWNQAVVDVVYTPEKAGLPVYLDMDEDVLAQIAASADFEGADPQYALLESVRGTLDLRPWGDVFHAHMRRVRRWRRQTRTRLAGQPLDAPPVLPLLAVLTLAAENMGSDSDFAAHAYYPRLYKLFGVYTPEVQAHVQEHYRACAENLWGALNQWLEALDGALGTPTAYALSFRYVGLPMSQALVRAADRRKLPDLFRLFGLAPGMQMAPDDMTRLLEGWVGQDPSPVSNQFRYAFAKANAKERIAEVVANELLSWDGTGAEGPAQGAPPVAARIIAGLRTFPVLALEVGLQAKFPGVEGPAAVSVASAVGEAPEIDFAPSAAGWLTARRLAGVDMGSLLSGLLVLQEKDSGATATRRPRSLVTLRRDELLGTFTEVERVQLGEDCLLLVRDEKGLAGKVAEALEQVARPGHTRVDGAPGLPEGWVLFRDVQVMAVGTKDLGAALNALVPIVTSQLTLAEGLKLPGRIRKFSTLDPPEIRAITQNADSLRVTLVANEEDPAAVSETWTSSSAALVVPLDSLSLGDGDYTIQLFEGDAKKPRQQSILRLRSSDTVDAFLWEQSPRLVYDLGRSGWGALSAAPYVEDVVDFVEGPFTAGDGEAVQSPVTADIWWAKPKPTALQASAVAAVVASPDPKSCIVTGAHYLELPTFYGKATGQTIDGVCKYCGLVKRLPAWAPRFKHGGGGAQQLLSLDVSQLEAVQKEKPFWGAAMDGLIHVGGGPIGHLERLALQVEGSSLFVDEFLRGLEALGHIQVERDAELRGTSFECSANYLAGLADREEYVATGCWSRGALAALRREVQQLGGSFKATRGAHGGPTRWAVLGLDHAAAQAAAQAAQPGAVVVPDAARAMLPMVDFLSTIRSSLKHVFLPGAKRTERFHLPSSSWVGAERVDSPGAYRLQASFMSLYVHASAQDVTDGRARLATAQLSKHLAALEDGRTLLAYDAGQQHLLVPVGAELPGLMGRVAVLCSGHLPLVDTRRRVVVYRGVPEDVAQGLAGLLAA